MSRYDYESTQQYAEQKFAEAKKYNEEQIKKQEKFSKRLLAFDTVVKGANALINQRADELESSFGPAKAKYKSYIQNAEATTTYWNDIQKNGGKSYLQDQIFNSYLAAAKKEKPYKDVENISGWIYNEATTKANELYSVLEQKAIQARDVPTMEDFIKDYENFTEIQAPRTLFGAATKGIKRILGRENAETLEYKKQIAKDKLFNTDVIKEIDEFAEIAETYDKLGYDTPGLIRKMNEQYKDGLGKKIKSTETQSYSFPTSKGRKKDQLVNIIKYTDGSSSVEVLLDNESLDTSLTMTEASEVSFLMRIKPEHQNEVIKILEKNGEGTALKTNLSEAVTYATSNNAFKVDLDDAKKVNDLADSNYQVVLQSKFTKEGMPMFEQDINTKDYRVMPEYLAQAKKEGWDAETYKQTQFDQIGINYKINQIKEGNIGTDLVKTTSIESKITDPSKLKEYNSVIENPNSNVYNFTQSQIKGKTSGIVDITNGNPVDLNKFFPDIVSGQGIIKYDIDNNKYYVEGVEGDLQPKFNAITLNKTDKTNDEVEFILPTEEQIEKLTSQPAILVRQSINKRNKLLEDLKDKENLSSIEIKSKENQIKKAEDTITKNITRLPFDFSPTSFVKEKGELKGIENLLSRPDRLSPNEKRELEDRQKELENLIK